MSTRWIRLLASVALLAGAAWLALSSRGGAPLEVFVAASLKPWMDRMAVEYQRLHPEQGFRIESGSSLLACRKVTDLGRTPDLIAVADYRDLDRLLRPVHADWTLQFAGNELVIAYRAENPRARDAGAIAWYDLLLRPDVRFGIAAPELAPAGYNALTCWRLADLRYASAGRSIAAELTARLTPADVRPDVAQLMAAVETGELDFAFAYRSEVQARGLRCIALPPEINLGDATRGAEYARVSVTVGELAFTGAPIVYGVTIPKAAARPASAAAFLAFLLERRDSLTEFGFLPLRPPQADPADAPPEVVKAALKR